MDTEEKLTGPELQWSDSDLEKLSQTIKDCGIPENMVFFKNNHFEAYKKQWAQIYNLYQKKYTRHQLAATWNNYIAKTILPVVSKKRRSSDGFNCETCSQSRVSDRTIKWVHEQTAFMTKLYRSRQSHKQVPEKNQTNKALGKPTLSKPMQTRILRSKMRESETADNVTDLVQNINQ